MHFKERRMHFLYRIPGYVWSLVRASSLTRGYLLSRNKKCSIASTKRTAPYLPQAEFNLICQRRHRDLLWKWVMISQIWLTFELLKMLLCPKQHFSGIIITGILAPSNWPRTCRFHSNTYHWDSFCFSESQPNMLR